jgi:hypothetical protein
MQIKQSQLAKNLVIRLVTEQRDTSALVTPNGIHDGHRDQHSRGDHWIDVTEFTGLDTAPDNSAQQLEATRDDFVGIEAGQIRELMQFAEDEAY